MTITYCFSALSQLLDEKSTINFVYLMPISIFTFKHRPIFFSSIWCCPPLIFYFCCLIISFISQVTASNPYFLLVSLTPKVIYSINWVCKSIDLFENFTFLTVESADSWPNYGAIGLISKLNDLKYVFCHFTLADESILRN